MTRENKISIIVAFGLLLFISMLIADHFSDAATKEVFEPERPAPPKLPNPDLIINKPPLVLNQPTKNESGDTVRKVLAGETLRSICRDAYGDSGLANSLAQWNGMANANSISVGQEISLPSRKLLITQLSRQEQYVESQPQPIQQQAQATQNTTGTYTVKSGDTLGEIAQLVMGSARKIDVLIDFNRKRLPNPDRLQVGMQLTYPIE
ncbi:MAG: LysM domain-containing protein [Planctomycetota bacterium]|nr:LysM domain-containing protein [Planctomycetota bacterium]